MCIIRSGRHRPKSWRHGEFQCFIWSTPHLYSAQSSILLLQSWNKSLFSVSITFLSLSFCHSVFFSLSPLHSRYHFSLHWFLFSIFYQKCVHPSNLSCYPIPKLLLFQVFKCIPSIQISPKFSKDRLNHSFSTVNVRSAASIHSQRIMLASSQINRNLLPYVLCQLR